MKKTTLMLSIILVFVLLSGCKKTDKQGNKNTDSSLTPTPTESVTNEITNIPEVTKEATPEPTLPVTEETNDTFTVADYYPIVENTKYVYEGIGNEYASFTVYTDYTTKDRVQTRTDNGGSEIVKVIEIKNGQLAMVLSRGEIYYRENLIEKEDPNTEILLKEPLVKGTEWTLADNRKRYISNVDVDITTPVGNYKAIEVTTEEVEGKNIDYYAPTVGLVKSVYSVNDYEVSSTLSKIEKDTPFTQTIRFYYPNVDESVLYVEEKQLYFLTNDITKIKLEEAFINITNEKFAPVLTKNARIKSLYLNKDNIVYVDFTKELVDEMNAGAGYEGMILQCITNTLGNYYGVNEVYITIEGEPYESGHILKKKGETIQVNTENVVNE